MIQAISGFSARGSLSGNRTNKRAYVSNNTHVSFKGLPVKFTKEALSSASNSRLAEEAKNLVTGGLRKIAGKNELPTVKKPVVAAESSFDKVADSLTDGVPVLGVIRTAAGAINGNEKAMVKGWASIVDNTLFAPAKQLVAIKASVVGGAIAGPPGAIIGYLGTIWGWGRIRNGIVNAFMD